MNFHIALQVYEPEPNYPDENVYEQGDEAPPQDDTYESTFLCYFVCC